MTTIRRGEAYWLDEKELARLAGTAAGLLLPRGGAAPKQSRISRLHPFLVVETSSLRSLSRQEVIGIFLSTLKEEERVRVARVPWRVIVEGGEVEPPDSSAFVAICNQIYTMPVSAVAKSLLRVDNRALARITRVLGQVVGLEDRAAGT
jgi:hypothetical protein